MQKKLLTAIIKSKITSKKEINQLKDEFIEHQTKTALNNLEEFLSSLMVYIHKNYETKGKDALVKIVQSKLKDLKVVFDTKDIDDVYERFVDIYTIKKSVETSIVFNEIDIKAIEMMRQNFYWVQDDYSQSVQDKIKDTIEDTFRGDSTREELANTLKDKFEGILKASSYYFNFVADHIINQSQNIARVNQALKYETKHFKVRARIDNKTSDICRSMHGRIIEATHLKNQIDAILDAKSIASKKAAAEWKNDPYFGKLPKNFGLPPYHGKCRTEVLPVWLNELEIDGKKVQFADKKKDDIISHIDNIGVQRTISKDIHKKLTHKKHGLKDKEIIAALNSIKEIAPHKVHSERFSAITHNGIYISFDATKVITMYKPSGNILKYFKENAKQEKKEVIKWNKESLLSGLISMIGR